MTTFNINLIKKDVLPPDVRRRLFWFVVLYCVACAIALVLVVAGATKRLVRAGDDVREAARIQDNFREMNPGHNDIMVYADQLQADMSDNAANLRNIERIVERRIYAAHIIKDLSEPLPRGVRVIDIDIDRDAGEMTFDLVVPENLAGGEINERDLLKRWSAAENLSRQVRNIRSVVSQRKKMESRPVLVIRFGCELAVKGK